MRLGIVIFFSILVKIKIFVLNLIALTTEVVRQNFRSDFYATLKLQENK